MRYVTESFPVFAAAGIAVDHSIPSSTANYYPYEGRTVKYIVLHYTGNSSDRAVSNARYFSGGSRSASAHYFVDDGAIYQSVRAHDGAWAVGGTRSYKHADCRNLNSISIEMCCSGNYAVSARTEANAAALCAELCRYIGINANDVDRYVLRHWDVWDKDCPSGWTGNGNARWKGFKTKVKALLSGEEIGMDQLNALKEEFAEYKKKTDRIINEMGGEFETLRKHAAANGVDNCVIYDYNDDYIPAWHRDAVIWATSHSIIRGDHEGKLGLTPLKLWVLTVLYRAAKYICKLMKVDI